MTFSVLHPNHFTDCPICPCSYYFPRSSSFSSSSSTSYFDAYSGHLNLNISLLVRDFGFARLTHRIQRPQTRMFLFPLFQLTFLLRGTRAGRGQFLRSLFMHGWLVPMQFHQEANYVDEKEVLWFLHLVPNPPDWLREYLWSGI